MSSLSSELPGDSQQAQPMLILESLSWAVILSPLDGVSAHAGPEQGDECTQMPNADHPS